MNKPIGDTFPAMVAYELHKARQNSAPFNSAHEAYAVILEELDEFWEEVRQKRSARSPEKMRAELVQVAAMCQRAAEDLHLCAEVPSAIPGIARDSCKEQLRRIGADLPSMCAFCGSGPCSLGYKAWEATAP